MTLAFVALLGVSMVCGREMDPMEPLPTALRVVAGTAACPPVCGVAFAQGLADLAGAMGVAVLVAAVHVGLGACVSAGVGALVAVLRRLGA